MRAELVFDHYPLATDTLPSGWSVTSIAGVARDVASGFPSGAHNQQGVGVPHIRPMNIDRQGRFDLSAVKYVEGEPARELTRGDVLFNNTNSPELVGKTTVVPVADRLGFSNHMTRIRLEAGLDPRFIAAQLHYLWSTGYFRHRCANHVNQASISAEPLTMPVPVRVPPTAEQVRIADAIDELLSDVDAAVASLGQARARLRAYRASVLKAAVDGTLTAEWRYEHPQVESASALLERVLAERRRLWDNEQVVQFEAKGQRPPKGWNAKYVSPSAPDVSELPALPATWCWASLDQLARIAGGVTKGQKSAVNEQTRELPYLRVANVQRGYLDLDQIKTISATEADIAALRLIPGDVLFNEGGDRDKLGRGWIWQGEIPECIHQNHVFRARLVSGCVSPKVVSWCGNSYGQLWFMRAGKQSVNLASINLAVLRSFPVALAPVEEQNAIVEIVDTQLSVVDHLEAELDAKLRTAQALRQSVLRHAFTGQLVPQDPTDEPASALLARIAAERAEQPDGPARRRASRARAPENAQLAL